MLELDPIDIFTELKSRHDSGEKNAGLNLFTNKIENVLEAKIIEPLKGKNTGNIICKRSCYNDFEN